MALTNTKSGEQIKSRNESFMEYLKAELPKLEAAVKPVKPVDKGKGRMRPEDFEALQREYIAASLPMVMTTTTRTTKMRMRKTALIPRTTWKKTMRANVALRMTWRKRTGVNHIDLA